MKTLTAIVVCLTLVVSSYAAEEKVGKGAKGKADQVLQQAQGKWVRTLTMEDKSYRMEKDIQGEKETVTIRDGDDVAYKWTVDFNIRRNRNVTVFTYKNMKMLVGPEETEPPTKPQSYLFQIRDDKWIEVHGLMNGDEGDPRLQIYDRVKE